MKDYEPLAAFIPDGYAISGGWVVALKGWAISIRIAQLKCGHPANNVMHGDNAGGGCAYVCMCVCLQVGTMGISMRQHRRSKLLNSFKLHVHAGMTHTSVCMSLALAWLESSERHTHT